MKRCLQLIGALVLAWRAPALEIQFDSTTTADALVLADKNSTPFILVETNNDRAVLRAVGDLANDFTRVTGSLPTLKNHSEQGEKITIIVGTLGAGATVDRLVAEGKLDAKSINGQWESYVLQVVRQPLPGVERALVIAGSDRRGTIFGCYELSERIGVSPWNWWADVPVAHHDSIAVSGERFLQGPPAVKYRGIFLNDEDWGLRPWASKTFDVGTTNLGPKTYAQIFELLLRLRANHLWPAMHPGTRAFNYYPADKEIADHYGIVMGSAHCEQMLRNNVDEWDDSKYGEYNYVSNRLGVLKYWEQRVRENSKYESLYTLGMRGIHDSGMPGGGTEREKATRLHQIITDQREMLSRLVNTNLESVPQIFCPYKEVLSLYRLAPNIPDDITLVWPDDNYGYIRQFSDAHERQRSGGAGVYYHVSYWGAPRDYLWLCSIPPALIAEEMAKAYDYGADKVWILNVGDLKPAELDIEFFLKLAWNPHAWNGTNTYELFGKQIARDFGPKAGPEISSILAEYYRLNIPRKPEHIGYPTAGLFSTSAAAIRLAEWESLVTRVDAVEKTLSPEMHDAFFELVAYPVKAAALANEKVLAPATAAQSLAKIHELTRIYNEQIAGGKWRDMMYDNPRGAIDYKPAAGTKVVVEKTFDDTQVLTSSATNVAGADFQELNHRCVLEAERASVFIPGKSARWQTIVGLGYNGEAVSVFPTTAPICASPAKIPGESPCLEYKINSVSVGDWKVTVRTLPTFSIEAGHAQRYAIALDDAPPRIVSLPTSMDERNRQWQENVLRNAALSSSQHTLKTSGVHTLKIWMVDPGIVIDAITMEYGAS